MCLCVCRDRIKKEKRESEGVWMKGGREDGLWEGSWDAEGEGGRDVGLSHPVPCCGDMSFSSIHRERARARERKTEREKGMEQ